MQSNVGNKLGVQAAQRNKQSKCIFEHYYEDPNFCLLNTVYQSDATPGKNTVVCA